MGQAIGEVLPLAIGIAISPVPAIVVGGELIGDEIRSVSS